LQGVTGAQGTTGSTGTQGVQGTQGIQGHDGLQGLIGIQGIQGVQGIQGNVGDRGIVAQTDAPLDTSILWLDTDEPAVDPNSAWSMGGFESGQRYSAAADSNNFNTNAVLSTTYFQPFFVPVETTFSTIGLQTSGTHTGSTTVRLGIYNNGTNVPTTVVVDAGTVVASTANAIFTITIDQTLSAGWYWLAFNAQTITGTPSVGHITPVPSWGYMRTNNSQNRLVGRVETGITGAFATVGTLGTGQTTSLPCVFLVTS
jgi:hypothetical protein